VRKKTVETPEAAEKSNKKKFEDIKKLIKD
jgi:hypothetical protein